MKSIRIVVLTAFMGISITAGAFSEEEYPGGDPKTPAAGPDVFQLETVVVTANAVSDSEEMIDDRELRSHRVVDLAEIISDELVEAQMIRKGSYGNEVSIRGFGQENIKVTVDGGILEGACGSRKDPPLSHLNMLKVKKLVVREGPFDATRQGALGGYVDVITKTPESGFNGEVLAKSGSFGFKSAGMVTSCGNKTVQGLIGYNYSESGQFEDGAGRGLWETREGMAASYNSRGRSSKAFEKDDLWGAMQLTPNDRNTLTLEHIYGKANNILTPRVVFDTKEEITNLTRARWEAKELGRIFEKLTLTLYRNAVEHRPSQELRNVDSPKNNEVKSVITSGSIQNMTETGAAILTYGIDLYHRDWEGDVYNSLTGELVNGNLIPSVTSDNTGAYLQAERVCDGWSVSAGLRYDRFRQKAEEELVWTGTVTDENRQIDIMVGGYISANYFIAEDSMFFGGVGRSHRTPTSCERYIQGNSGFFGNPGLKPTANTEVDLGFRHESAAVAFQVKTFYSDLKDYIYQENNVRGYKTYANIDAHIYGGDMTADINLVEPVSLGMGIAWQRGLKDTYPDSNSDGDLGQIAPVKSRISLKYNKANPFGTNETGVFGSVEWVCSGKAQDIDTDAGEKPLSSWNIVNLRAGCTFGSWTLNLGVDNLFDREYTVVNSYEWDVVGGSGANPAIVNEPGRFLYASLDFGW